MLNWGMEPTRLTPSQTAEILNVSRRTLRRWSVAFADSLSPGAARKGKRRSYDGEDVETLRRAGKFMEDGLSTKQAAEVLPVRDKNDETSTALVLAPEAQVAILQIAEKTATALERIDHVADRVGDQSDELDKIRRWLELPWWKRIFSRPQT